jgi:hypothetical protein
MVTEPPFAAFIGQIVVERDVAVVDRFDRSAMFIRGGTIVIDGQRAAVGGFDQPVIGAISLITDCEIATVERGDDATVLVDQRIRVDRESVTPDRVDDAGIVEQRLDRERPGAGQGGSGIADGQGSGLHLPRLIAADGNDRHRVDAAQSDHDVL